MDIMEKKFAEVDILSISNRNITINKLMFIDKH